MEPIQPVIPIEEQFAIMANSAPVLIWIAGPDKLCYFFNAGWLKFTGRTLEQEYGNGWAEGVHPDDLQHCLDIYISAFDARQEFKIEYRLRRHDGVYQWILDNGVPRYAANGAFAGYIGSCMVIDELLESDRLKREFISKDILQNEKALNEELMATNEELAEMQRRLQETIDELRQADVRSAKLAAIVESSDDAIIGKDLDGIITSWNRGAQQIFGYSEKEMIGQSILKLIPENLQHEEPMILSRLRKGEKIDHYETTRRAQDGRLIDVALTISPIRDKEEHVVGVSKIARDISERKRDEQRKNDFIGMVSHELKTPLTTLNALIQVLQMKLAGKTEDFITSVLARSVQQTRKMTDLINGFLNVSRLESGKLLIDKERFDLTALVREIIDEVKLTVTTHEIILNAPGPVQVLADQDKIGSVISNLLSNAVKYSPKSKLIMVGCRTEGNDALVSVQDEGIGISPQDKDKLFERYYRVTSDTTRNISGFGVGLYLSAEIIARHDGRIWVESEKGAGSTFYFTLPL
ncbi:MAG TPA: PAS domain S-box protein [Mucilaginibacter sp.]|jgi:PAS domain S-box-containing protein|nr:PAS domain S-box protein [Mucilaginibacter sp.]